MEARERVSQEKSGRDGNDEAEDDIRKWIEIEKISQSSDGDEGEMRGVKSNDADGNAGELCPVSRV